MNVNLNVTFSGRVIVEVLGLALAAQVVPAATLTTEETAEAKAPVVAIEEKPKKPKTKTPEAVKEVAPIVITEAEEAEEISIDEESDEPASPDEIAELRKLIPAEQKGKDEFRKILKTYADSIPLIKKSQVEPFKKAVAHLIDTDL